MQKYDGIKGLDEPEVHILIKNQSRGRSYK